MMGKEIVGQNSIDEGRWVGIGWVRVNNNNNRIRVVRQAGRQAVSLGQVER